MKMPSEEEQRRLVRQWESTGRELERLRRQALRGMPYRWEDLDALLQLGAEVPTPENRAAGLVEMQRWFMKADPRRPKRA